MSALYPDVPKTPGVPNVFRLPGTIETDVVPLLADASALSAIAPLWGIYDDGGSSLIDADSVLAVEYQTESTISDYPIEQGGFQSYNKVDRPYSSRVQLVKSGKSVDRTAYLQQIEALRASTDTCTVVTPERVYENANVVRYDYARRSTEGAQAIVVEIQLEEIRKAAASSYSNTREPSGADPVNDGSVQATPTSTDTTPAVNPPVAQ